MLKALKLARGAFGMMNPDEVSRRANYPLTIGLVAVDTAGYAGMEDYLLPAAIGHEERMALMERVFRAGDPGSPDQCDLVFYQAGLTAPPGAYVLDPEYPEEAIAAILCHDEDLMLPLARSFRIFRRAVVDHIVKSVARENALFALATALPNVLPSLIELPWAVGEFASDTAFMTMNQIRMSFLVAAACGRGVGFGQQKTEMFSIVAGAFGWRAIARELAGKIPLGGGLIPKGAIAYAGTYVIGKGLEQFNRVRRMPTRSEREAIYQAAYEEGKGVAEGLRRGLAVRREAGQE
jgi:hypothetical protein